MKRACLLLAALLAAAALGGCATLKAWSRLEQERQVDCAAACPACQAPCRRK